MRRATLPFTGLCLLLAAIPLDLGSFCKGACLARYQDGAWSASRGACACIDYLPVNLRQRFQTPKRPGKPSDPHVYDGQDEMHVPVAEPTLDTNGDAPYF